VQREAANEETRAQAAQLLAQIETMKGRLQNMVQAMENGEAAGAAGSPGDSRADDTIQDDTIGK